MASYESGISALDHEEPSIEVVVRHYQPKDLVSCRALWAELTEWHRQIYQDPSIGGDDPGRYFDEHLEQVGSEHIWVAEVDSQIVGLTGIILGESEAELEPLVVSEGYRGSGIGRQLTEVVIQTAREEGVKYLNVRPVARNASAIGFFHEQGFDILGRIELFMDLTPSDNRTWNPGEKITGKRFRL